MGYWKIKDVDNARPLFFVISFNRRKITVNIALKLSKAYSKLSVLLEYHSLSSTALDGSSIAPQFTAVLSHWNLVETWLVWFHPRPTESSPAGLTLSPVLKWDLQVILKHIKCESHYLGLCLKCGLYGLFKGELDSLNSLWV